MSPWLHRLRLDPARRWTTLALAGWVILCVVVLGLFVAKPEKVTGFAPYLKGASRWVEGVDIYSFKPNKGFVYSPLAAVFFVPFTAVPPAVANVVWRLLSIGVLLGGVWVVLRWGPFRQIPRAAHGLVFLLLLPLSLSNIDSGQANPLVIGLLLAGVACAVRDRWALSAVCVAAAVHWKIYPVVVGLLLMVIAPIRFSWRFLVALALLGVLPFAFQQPDYVARQYHEWIATRLADNRLAYGIEIAPLDLWFVLVRVLHLPLNEMAYHGIQAAGGAGIAAFCLTGRLRGWPRSRLLGGLFVFVSIWMVLLGPASEWLTYLLVAPAVALVTIEAFTPGTRPAVQVFSLGACGLLLLAVLRVGFFPKWQGPWLLALQPVAAIVFSVAAVARYRRAWDAESEADRILADPSAQRAAKTSCS